MLRNPQKTRSSALYTLPVMLLILVVGISYLGLGFVVPLRSLYGRELGASSAEISLMTTSFLLAGVITSPFIGWLTDRWTYRRILFLGVLLHGLMMLAYIPVRDPLTLIGLRAIEGVAAAAVLPPARAFMNAIAPSERQGEALGLISAAQTVGLLLGPVAGALLASQTSYNQAFLVASIPLILGAVLTLAILPATRSEQKTSNSAQERPGASRRELFTRPLILAYVLQFALFITNGVGATIWTLYMQDRGASLPLIGLSYTTFALPIIFLAPVLGRLSDRYGRYQLLILGLLLYSLIIGSYALPLSPILIIWLSIVEGIALCIARAATDGFLADVMPMNRKGQVQGTNNTIGTLGNLLGATSVGFLYLISPGAPFLTLGFIYFSLTVVLFLPSLAALFPRMHRISTETETPKVL